MSLSRNHVRNLACEIFVSRMQHLPADYWDFRPIADASITAAQVFGDALDERLPPPADQMIHAQLSVEAPFAKDSPTQPVHPGDPNIVLPPNPVI